MDPHRPRRLALVLGAATLALAAPATAEPSHVGGAPLAGYERQALNLEEKIREHRETVEHLEEATDELAAEVEDLEDQAAEVAAEAPVSTPYSGDIVDIIAAAANRHGLDPAYLIGVAACESELDPGAVSDSGAYVGLFQFDTTTWAAFGSGDRTDPVAASEAAASLIAAGQASRWPICA